MNNADHLLSAQDDLTELCNHKGLKTWNELTEFIRTLPYGRNANRTDFSLVLKEGKGSCSSKHAFLKQLADLNSVPNVQLILGMYKMQQTNTPKIGSVLSDNGLDYIPEAHCYLKVNNERIDFTSANADFKRLENDILEEIEIVPEQVAEYKVSYHKAFLEKWITENRAEHSFEELWKLRETCITNLSH